MSVAESDKRLSEAAFLQFERRAEIKSEFFDGEMFAMAGGTRNHSLIAANLTRELGNRLKGRPCVTYNADLRVKVEATGLSNSIRRQRACILSFLLQIQPAPAVA